MDAAEIKLYQKDTETMSTSKKFEDSEQKNSIVYNVDDFIKVNDIVQSSAVDRQNCTPTSNSEELGHKNTAFLLAPVPYNDSNIMNPVEEQCIGINCAETRHAENDTSLIQDMIGTTRITKDEKTNLSNENNMIVTQVSESSEDDNNIRLETVLSDDGIIKEDTPILTNDYNMTEAQVSADSEADKNISLEVKFCDKTEGEKGNKLPLVDVDEWCKHFYLLCLTQLLVRVLMEALRNLKVIKIHLQKGIVNYFQILTSKTSCFISEKIHQVINGTKLGRSIVTFAVREYITCNGEPFIRLILNDEDNKKFFLVREYFRLETFGHYFRSNISQPIVLKLARNGYYCDPDGTVRCFKCYRELLLTTIHTYGVHNCCRSSYRQENISIADSYGHLAPDWILAVNQQNQNDSVIGGLPCFDDVVLNRTPLPQVRYFE